MVGARGYAGLELVKLLLGHPDIQVKSVFASEHVDLSDELRVLGKRNIGRLASAKSLVTLPHSEILTASADFVFLATPAEVSLELAPKLLALGKRVIDLSGAFRLKTHGYPEWYGFSHDQSQVLSRAEYGLQPWNASVGLETQLVANPGCYATAILLALLPLLKRGWISPSSIVIDAKSGTTGAGRKASEAMQFSEVSENCWPYKVGRHQHWPEIVEAVKAHGGGEIDPFFTTHILPVRRGILASVYASLVPEKELTEGAIREAFLHDYATAPLVRLGPVTPQFCGVSAVAGSAATHLGFVLSGQKLFLFSCLDNLLKGAASQAIENMNCMMGWPSWRSLSFDAQTTTESPLGHVERRNAL